MKPVRTSTPKGGFRRVSGRKSIHDPQCLSPINPKSPLNADLETKEIGEAKVDEENNETDDEHDEIDENEEENDSDEEEQPENIVKSRSQKSCEKECVEIIKIKNYNWIKNRLVNLKNESTLPQIIMGAIVMILVLIIFLFPINVGTKKSNIKSEISNLELNYPNQNPDLWIFVTSSIKEVLRYNKPSVILFLYLENQEKITNDLIQHISQIAQEKLNKNILEPLIINGSDLNTDRYQTDYGILIEEYKQILEQRHVLAVKNLETVSVKVSQAFHYLCDEVNPLVEKSFFVFTVKVKEFIGKEIDQAGIVLKIVWGDLEDDKLEPLVTRVTSLVLRINPE